MNGELHIHFPDRRLSVKGSVQLTESVREEILRGDYTCRTDVVNQYCGKIHSVCTYDDFKSLDKQRGTYFEGLVLRRFPNGRIYTDFKIHGTESGRLSSSNPNLQNVTRPKAGMPSIRACFVADPGCSLVSADFLKQNSERSRYSRAMHTLSLSFSTPDAPFTRKSLQNSMARDYTYEQYVRAKNINFGVAYWQSAFSFAQMYHMPVSEAQKFVDFWWSRFPQVWDWTKATEKEVLENGELQSPFGHKRRFYVIPADQSGRLHVVKEGINFRPQNIAGNITLWAMEELTRTLDWDVAQVRLNVHDNIVVNCRNKYVEQSWRTSEREQWNVQQRIASAGHSHSKQK
jgi:DNA polymerase-1